MSSFLNLFTPDTLSRERCDQLIQRVNSLTAGAGESLIQVTSGWRGDVQWSRNRTSMASDASTRSISLHRMLYGARAGATETNQLDDLSLRSLVQTAEQLALIRPLRGEDFARYDIPVLPSPSPAVWHDSTLAVTAARRAELVRQLTQEAEAHGLLSAGYIKMGVEITAANHANPHLSRFTPEIGGAGGRLGYTSGLSYYAASTPAECSITVRHPEGRASGWAGVKSYDWATIDPVALAKRALDKCLASLDPVRAEPGRYVVVLEPQAVADLMKHLLGFFGRTDAESTTNPHPFQAGPDQALGLMRSQLGLKIVDERVTLRHDPMDPLLGVPPLPGLAPVTWIERGVLKTLNYLREIYGLEQLNDQMPVLSRNAYRLDVAGPTASIETMIEQTKRGLLVSRFSGSFQSGVMVQGVTRDGLWLIEDGKVTKAVKNMTFLDSPLFVLNNLEQAGTPVKVFDNAVVPPLKAREFSFTALTDAV